MRTYYRQCRIPLATAMLLMIFFACTTSEAQKQTSQFAAKVNGQEISVHQINFVLARANTAAVPLEQAPKVRQEVHKLVDQRLVVEQAGASKLDR